MIEFVICVVAILVLAAVLNIWLLWYWALMIAAVVVIVGVFVVTEGMLDG